MAKRFTRLEIRNDVKVAGGAVTDQIPARFVQNPRTEHPVGRVPTLSFNADPEASYWTNLVRDHVVTTHFSDDTWEEFRIVSREVRRENDNESAGSVTAHGIWGDLASDSDLVEDVQADGATFLQFSTRAVRPKGHIDDFILPAAPPYFRRGTVEFQERVDVQYSLDSAQSALDKLASKLVSPSTFREAEIDVRRGTSDDFYYIDLLERVGSTATKVWIRYSVNELALSDRADNRTLANTVYPVGAGVNNIRATMAEAAWEVLSFSGSLQSSPTLTLADDPVWADGVLDGFWAESFVSEQATSPTSETDGFSAAQNAAAPENGDVQITALGGVAFSNLEDANGELTTYTAFFDVDTTSLVEGETITVHLDHNSAAGDTSFTQSVASRQYEKGENLTDEKLSAELTLGADLDLQLRVTGEAAPGSQETDGFSATRNAAAPENGDVALTTDGGTAFSNLEDANGVQTTFNVFYDITTGDLGGGGRQMLVLVELSDAATGGSFSTVATKFYGSNVSLTGERITFDASPEADYDIRVTTQQGTATAVDWTVTLHGEDHASEAGVQYTLNQSGSFVVTAHGEDNTEPGVQYQKQPGPAEGAEPVLNEITASTAPNQITLSGSLGASTADVVRVIVRKNSGGDDLLFLQKAGATTKRPFVLERPDILPVTNLAKNPLLAEKSGSQPVGFELVGSPSIEEVTDRDFWRHGGRSWKITAAEGEGIETVRTAVFPSASRPHISSMWRLYVDSGKVRHELLDVTSSTTYPPVQSERANSITTTVGTWIEALIVDPQEADFFALGTAQVRARLLAHNGAATFYVDACSINPNTFGGVDFVRGAYPNRLWKKAQEFIQSDQSGADERTMIRMLNRKRLDTSLTQAEPEKGADIGIRDPDIGVEVDRRILTVIQRLDHEGDAEVDVGV